MVTLELEARLDNLLAIAQEETADLYIFAPIPAREECPLCMIPLPLNEGEASFMSCCGKLICNGCTYKEVLNDLKSGISKHELLNKHKCAFCRQVKDTTTIKATKKLTKNNNPQAFMMMAAAYKSGEGVFQSDTKALEMRIRAAELGIAEAYTFIGAHYAQGIAVEQNTSKALAFNEIGAKKGSIYAHKFLADFLRDYGDVQTSIEHSKVAASAGDEESMGSLMKAYKEKSISKEELSQTLRLFQASSDEMKSKDRDAMRLVRSKRVA